MPQPKKVRKPSRVVFSIGVPMPIERAATRIARRLKIKRNAYICLAIAERVERDEPPKQSQSVAA